MIKEYKIEQEKRLPFCKPLITTNSYIKEYEVSKTLIDKKWDDIMKAVIDIIDLDQYVYLDINTSYISNYKSFKQNQIHDLFIYGYNLEKKVIYVADFFENGVLIK